MTSNKFVVASQIGTYIIYSLNGNLTLTANAAATSLEASGKFTGVLRIARLIAAAHEPTLDQYSGSYPTAVALDYAFDGDSATMSFTWSVTGNASDLLMLTWPHHRCGIALVRQSSSPSQQSARVSELPGDHRTLIPHDQRLHVSRSRSDLEATIRASDDGL